MDRMASKVVPTLIAVVLIGFTVALSADECHYDIVESMPESLAFNGTMSFKPRLTHESLIEMVDDSKHTLRIASFYVTLTAEPEFGSHPSAAAGRELRNAIARAVQRGVNLEVVLDGSSSRPMNNPNDVQDLEALGSVKFVNMTKLMGSGVLHTKFMIADNSSFYVGSSNFDWRSYTQIKEIGIAFKDCRVLAEDLDKIFRTYMMMADSEKIPSSLSHDLHTAINIHTPLKLVMDNFEANLFLGSSPPTFNGVDNWTGRTDDIDGLIHIIDNARRYVNISVMNYGVTTFWPKKFWPRIDNALRRAAAERRVKVNLLVSYWNHIHEGDMMWYRSLNAIQSSTLRGGGIHVKLFQVPAFDEFQKNIPYARVKHDKYMITENGLYIGTSNWSPDYFLSTCGVSVVIESSQKHAPYIRDSILNRMRELFTRDFESSYSMELDQVNITYSRFQSASRNPKNGVQVDSAPSTVEETGN